MPSSLLRSSIFFSISRKEARRHLSHAKRLLSTLDPADVQVALSLLDAALKVCPQWEKAMELKARALLHLRRYKEVVCLLRDFIPSVVRNERGMQMTDGQHPAGAADKESTKLLEDHPAAAARMANMNSKKEEEEASTLFSRCLPSSSSRRNVRRMNGFAQKGDKKEQQQWRYAVLGQACCHLGMMEDAMILLSKAKKVASAATRKQSNDMREDGFLLAAAAAGGDRDDSSDLAMVSGLLGDVKFLLRRRATAMAALQAGLFEEAARHLSKILEGRRRGTPQGFVADCYMHRAAAYHAANRLVDALADCNRALALNPSCADALSTRSAIYESIGCLADCLHDLHLLMSMYRADRKAVVLLQDVKDCLDRVARKADAIRHQSSSFDHDFAAPDYHLVLGLSRGCSRNEVERAYLLLILRHRPDQAAHFVDRCEFVDERDVDAVRDEARVAGLKLVRLVQRAYVGLITAVTRAEISMDVKRIRHAAAGVMAGRESSCGDEDDRDDDAEDSSSSIVVKWC